MGRYLPSTTPARILAHRPTPDLHEVRMLHINAIQDMWSACFGASVARQVHDRIAQGKGPPGHRDMDGIIEEAESIADMAVDAIKRLEPR